MGIKLWERDTHILFPVSAATGFALQCLYTEDGEIDKCYRVKNDELVEFPKGYHTNT
ncbi:MAG: 5-deoxy-glucuronate isomerase [Bacillota bacterium]